MSEFHEEFPPIEKSITKTLSDLKSSDLDICSAALDDLVSLQLEHKIPSGRIDETFSHLVETSADDRKLIRRKSVETIGELTSRESLPDQKVIDLFETLIERSSITMGMDEDVLTLLIQKSKSVKNPTIQKYAMESIKKFTETNAVSNGMAGTIVDFLVSVTDNTLQEIAIEGIIQLARFMKIDSSRFRPVYDHLLSIADSAAASNASKLKALDGLNALLLGEDPDASEVLMKITQSEVEPSNNTFTSVEYEAQTALFVRKITATESSSTSFLGKYLDVVAILLLAAKDEQSRLFEGHPNVLSEATLEAVFKACEAHYHSKVASEAVQQSAAIAIACIGVHALSPSNSLAEELLDFFIAMDRADETYNQQNNKRELNKKRSIKQISFSPEGEGDDEGQVSSAEEARRIAQQLHSHSGITTQDTYYHILMSVAIGLKGMSTLLLYKNIHSLSRTTTVVEMILERTFDLAEDAAVTGLDTTIYGYMTSCAFLGVRRIMELNILSEQRVSNEILNLLVNGANYERNIYGKSRSSARLALAELIIRTGHFPVERREELLGILATKKEKGFSDHNLKPTPKEHLVSCAIQILNSTNKTQPANTAAAASNSSSNK